MSEFPSDDNFRSKSLTVRIKLVNLNSAGAEDRASHRTFLAGEVAMVGFPGERATRHRSHSGSNSREALPPEICAYTGRSIPHSDFENHLEECNVCANRVELQLDFMETLEVAIYQRKAQPNSRKIHGAMLVSAPELNFAICGEIEAGF